MENAIGYVKAARDKIQGELKLVETTIAQTDYVDRVHDDHLTDTAKPRYALIREHRRQLERIRVTLVTTATWLNDVAVGLEPLKAS